MKVFAVKPATHWPHCCHEKAKRTTELASNGQRDKEREKEKKERREKPKSHKIRIAPEWTEHSFENYHFCTTFFLSSWFFFFSSLVVSSFFLFFFFYSVERIGRISDFVFIVYKRYKIQVLLVALFLCCLLRNDFV